MRRNGGEVAEGWAAGGKGTASAETSPAIAAANATASAVTPFALAIAARAAVPGGSCQVTSPELGR